MNVLFVNLARMGDLVQITPAAVGLKAEQDARVTLLAPTQYAEFARRLDGIDEVIGFDDANIAGLDDTAAAELVRRGDFWSRWIAPLRERRFDRVINLTHDQLSTALVQALEIPDTLGRCGEAGTIRVRGAWFRYFYAVLNHRELNPFNLCDLYRRGVGVRGHYPVSMTPLQDDFVRADELLGDLKSSPLVLLHPGANHPLRRWPVERFAELAKLLAGRGAEVRLLAGPGEEKLAENIERLSQGAAKRLTGRVSTELLPALLSRADLMVTNDTGPLHIAAAVGTKTVSIFLAMARPQDTAPYRENQWILESTHPEHPAPEHPEVELTGCSRSIPVEAVVKASQAALEGLDSAAIRWPNDGMYRALRTSTDEAGFLRLEETFNSTGRDLDAESEPMRAVWRAMLDGDFPNTQQDAAKLNDEERDTLTQAMILGESIAARLRGEEVVDGAGRSLSVRDLEALWLSLEKTDNKAAALLLPQRLEREALYTRGLDTVKQEFEARFTRWRDAVTRFTTLAVGEAVA